MRLSGDPDLVGAGRAAWGVWCPRSRSAGGGANGIGTMRVTWLTVVTSINCRPTHHVAPGLPIRLVLLADDFQGARVSVILRYFINEKARLLGRKTLENEVLQEAIELARGRKWIARSSNTGLGPPKRRRRSSGSRTTARPTLLPTRAPSPEKLGLVLRTTPVQSPQSNGRGVRQHAQAQLRVGESDPRRQGCLTSCHGGSLITTSNIRTLGSRCTRHACSHASTLWWSESPRPEMRGQHHSRERFPRRCSEFPRW